MEFFDFAVSIFHAYGHRWECQLVYNPRKRKGFALTDGEACERIWSQLKFLISVCRVSGVSFPVFVQILTSRPLTVN